MPGLPLVFTQAGCPWTLCALRPLKRLSTSGNRLAADLPSTVGEGGQRGQSVEAAATRGPVVPVECRCSPAPAHATAWTGDSRGSVPRGIGATWAPLVLGDG